MPKKNQPPEVYKTESQLKEEALAKHTAEIEAEAEVHKSVLQKKHENFWYHYKWHTIACVFAAFLLVFFIKDIFFRTKPDVTVIVISERFLSDDDLGSLTSVMQDCATDYNGDDKIVITTDFISMPNLYETEQDVLPAPDLTGGQQEIASTMKLMAILTAGTDPIYLLDEAAYDYIKKIGQGEDGSQSGDVFEAFSVPVESLDREKLAAFKDMRLYLRAARIDDVYYDYCKQLLEALAQSSSK